MTDTRLSPGYIIFRKILKISDMKYLDTNSLFRTIDNVSEAILFNLDIDQEKKEQIADFIADQQGKPYTYAGTFAPTENDLILFTRDKIKSRVGKCHMIGEEASRVLRKLDVQNEKVNIALQKADKGLQDRITKYIKESRYEYGTYCCKSCSCGLWMNLSSGGLNLGERFLEAGMNYLKRFRDDSGRWKGFPYYYTLYVLNEIETDIAMDEMKFAARSIEKRVSKKKNHENKYDLRRDYIGEQILNKVNN